MMFKEIQPYDAIADKLFVQAISNIAKSRIDKKVRYYPFNRMFQLYDIIITNVMHP